MVDAIKSLNKGKAADSMGIMAEHIQFGGSQVVNYIHELFKVMFKNKIVPDEIKEGLLTPILKKKKDPKDPTSYRGITVLITIEKLFEKVWLTKCKPVLDKLQNWFQRGFTEQSSSVNASLMFSEVLNEAHETKQPVYAVTLDGQRAFDTVWIKSLLRKIFFAKIPHNFWDILNQLYTNALTRIKFANDTSDLFPLHQGVRQGGILSANLYKQFNNDLLDTLKQQNIGAKIGHLQITAPTCADDICCLTNSATDLQTALFIVENFVNKERFCINNSKSDILCYNTPKVHEIKWELCNQNIQESQTATHLGIVRNINQSVDVDKLIQQARRTLYSMFGSGLHGKNGLNPKISKHIWSTYIIPRLTFGLEILNLNTTQIKKLEQFQIKILRQLQWLPDRCSNVAVHLLLGLETVESIIDKKTLILFGQIVRDQNTLEFNIAQRQIAIYDAN